MGARAGGGIVLLGEIREELGEPPA
jgi:hypothetical protein